MRHRLSLDTVILHNFKSFRHANIRFDNGFNCIIGPNGSGKSAICDSLLFALGESSMRRMRVTAFPQLINNDAKPKKEDGTKRAYVKLTLKGDESVEIARIIKSNGKVGYRLNGKHATRQDVIDFLRSNRAEINETNTITQGEISTMLSLNARERRELIDIAAGIREFDDKKTASMGELEKVESKIREADGILNTMQGFLNDLEKEKQAAEQYTALQGSVKSTSYTILKTRERAIMGEFERTLKQVKDREQKRLDSDKKIAEVDRELERLTKEKEGITRTLNEKSVAVGTMGKRLELANTDIAVKEEQIGTKNGRVSELGKVIGELKATRAKLADEIAHNEAALKQANGELDEKAARLKQIEVLDAGGAGSLLGKLGENQKLLDKLGADLDAISNNYMQHEFSLDSVSSKVEELKKSLEENESDYGNSTKAAKGEEEKLAAIKRETADAQRRLEKVNAEIAQQGGALDRIYSESTDIRAQLAASGHVSDRSADVLAKSMKSGFFGKAYELCSYDSKHTNAVNAAAGQRLNYFVVDSTETASSAIKVLKEKNLGRASFIPLDDVVVRQTNAADGLRPLLECVKFEKKYERAFMYIFSNTYLVDSIEAAKRRGLGERRYVTLDGELVEQSGIITGGPMRVSQSFAALESKLRKLDEEKRNATGRLAELNAEADSVRKAIATRTTDAFSHEMEAKSLKQRMEKLSSALDVQRGELKELEKKRAQLAAEAEELREKREKVASGIAAVKAENERLYSISAAQPKKGRAKVNADELKGLREEVEGTKIRIAELTKENEMRSGRIAEIEKELDASAVEVKSLRKSISALDGELAELKKSKEELQEKIKSHDTRSAGLYKEMQQFEEKYASSANEKGRFTSERDRAERELIELNSGRSSLETRLNDIKAELLSYPDMKMVEGKKMEELEASLAVAKADLERLGNVNLKAPETYEEKKKDVDSMRGKLEVLGNEKNSILAMINEIESKKLNIFVDTLKAVNDNFKNLYSTIFDGSAYLYIEKPTDPFNSGLLFSIKSASKKERLSEQLSGGEKSLLMLMLIFAIQMRNPMSFYIFDEIDAALDKENSKKLSRLLRELGKSSQFIIVSHNDSLITSADAAIGVAKKSDESIAVGLQLNASAQAGYVTAEKAGASA